MPVCRSNFVGHGPDKLYKKTWIDRLPSLDNCLCQFAQVFRFSFLNSAFHPIPDMLNRIKIGTDRWPRQNGYIVRFQERSCWLRTMSKCIVMVQFNDNWKFAENARASLDDFLNIPLIIEGLLESLFRLSRHSLVRSTFEHFGSVQCCLERACHACISLPSGRNQSPK